MRTPYQVPTELQHLVTGEVIDEHARWRNVTEAEVAQRMHDSIHTVDIGGDRNVRLGIIGENQGGTDLVLSLPHQQEPKVPMWLRAEWVHKLVNPNGRTFVLPNNGSKSNYYAFTDNERQALHRGDGRPFGEMWARALERKGVGKAALTGYSLGGFTALSIAEVNPGFDVTHVDVNDTPSKVGRNPKQLQKDFLASGGFGDQLAAIKDANIPVLSDVYSPLKLGLDYARYGLATRNADNKALHHAMAWSRERQVLETIRNYPEVVIKLAHVAGSQLFDPESISYPGNDGNFRKQEYTGPGTHNHPTGDNPIVHALMVLDGVGRLSQCNTTCR